MSALNVGDRIRFIPCHDCEYEGLSAFDCLFYFFPDIPHNKIEYFGEIAHVVGDEDGYVTYLVRAEGSNEEPVEFPGDGMELA